ncbi:UNVERIFIED_CONTAM: hypothetical protein Slati_0521600 [Sesamum latifolium]|uniref:Uncharacterized protein n=1 Tax=Sesamum latifolium TaxID=2727402 RepID=A0AAW2XXS9_9LAMI
MKAPLLMSKIRLGLPQKNDTYRCVVRASDCFMPNLFCRKHISPAQTTNNTVQAGADSMGSLTVIVPGENSTLKVEILNNTIPKELQESINLPLGSH